MELQDTKNAHATPRARVVTDTANLTVAHETQD